MAKRTWTSIWAKGMARRIAALRRAARPVRTRASGRQPVAAARKRGTGKAPGSACSAHWLAGVAIGASGARRYRLYRLAGLAIGDRRPLLVMLHGCGQDAKRFAASTRMNRISERERFLVLYPEQDRLANAHGCWNWFDTRSGRAGRETALIMAAIDQVYLLYPVALGCTARRRTG